MQDLQIKLALIKIQCEQIQMTLQLSLFTVYPTEIG